MKQSDNRVSSQKKSSSIQPLNHIKSALNIRMLFGAVLIVASFVSAFLISNSASRMVTVWSATIDLAPGSVIDEEDIEKSQVLLPRNVGLYIDGNSPIVGSYVIRSIGAAELIPAYALSQEPISDLRKVPISIPGSRMPFRIGAGEYVDIYSIPKQQLSISNDGKVNKPGLVVSNIAIDGIDLEASKLGGEIGVTLLVPQALVAKIVNALATSEFILVKSP